MADSRRLIELLMDKPFGNSTEEREIAHAEDVAEYLISNGVTVRERGRWIMKQTMIRSPFAKNAYCSECLEETGYAHNFCPNCGADMRGEEDAPTEAVIPVETVRGYLLGLIDEWNSLGDRAYELPNMQVVY